MINYLLEQSTDFINYEEISYRLLRLLKKKSERVIGAIEGYKMTDIPKHRMCLIFAHMDYITSIILDIDSKIDSLVESYENDVRLLCILSRVDDNSAIAIIFFNILFSALS